MDPDLRDLLKGWLGEDLEPVRADELLARLNRDHDFRGAFVAEIRMLGMLHAVQSAEPRWLALEDELGLSNVDESLSMDEFHEQVRRRFLAEAPRPWYRKRNLIAAAAMATACLLVIAGLSSDALRSKPARPTGILGVVAKLEGVEWEATEGQRPAPGETLGAGFLRFRAGRVTLSLFNGVELFLEGPAVVELVTLDKVALHRGKLRVRVGKGAEGFAVSGPSSLVVDLGTEFAMNVGEDGISRGKVFRGKVDAALLNAEGNPSRTRDFKTGDVFVIDPLKGQVLAISESEPFATPSNSLAPPLATEPGYAAEILRSRPWSYWRFESLTENAVPNEIAGHPPLRVTGPIRLNGAPGSNRSAVFEEGYTWQFLALEGTWQPPRKPGFAVELWFQSELVSHSSLVSLVAPKDTNLHYFLMETTCRQRTAIQHPPDLVRLLHRWPPGRDGGMNLYSNNPYVPFRWHHLVGQINKDRMELILDGEFLSAAIIVPLDDANLSHDRRVDGEALSLKSVVDSITSKPCQLLLGRLSTIPIHSIGTSRPFVGQLDEVAVYDRPLTIAEIRRHFQSALQQK